MTDRWNATLRAQAREYRYLDVDSALSAYPEATRRALPLALRIFLENVLRRADAAQSEALVAAIVKREGDMVFHPSRVILQDLLATPALADLAGLRDAVAARGGDPARVNPLVPVDLVIDHSVSVEHTGAGALELNMAIERRQNAERFEFFDWSGKAFRNLRIVPPGNGILHQINLERFSPVIVSERVGDAWCAYPDTLVGTDSHTPMINALGVLGWGVGGIEAEAVMLGRGISMRVPEIVGVQLTGRLPAGVLATDLALFLAERFRAEGVVGAILEFFGPGVQTLSVADRATVSNMSPEYGATSSLFPIDSQTIDYLTLTGRTAAQCRLVEAYAKAQGFRADQLTSVQYDRTIGIDLSSVGTALAGPREPHQRIPLSELKQRGIAGSVHASTSALAAYAQHERRELREPVRPERSAAKSKGEQPSLPESAVVIAAITSCTNTSNPRGMIAAGLLAKKAVERGLSPAPWVKRSLGPGSRAVLGYLEAAGLYAPMQALGFDVVGFGCTTCAGMSGALAPEVEREIAERKIDVTAVLSGNRNFDGRIHPLVRHAYLASPPLVVAYAIAGSTRIDVENDPIARDANGRNVLLRDVWPSDAEIDAVLAEHVSPQRFLDAYGPPASETAAPTKHDEAPAQFAWSENSTYVRRPPYWDPAFARAPRLKGMRALAILGDNITTDHISPAGAIARDSAAGRLLESHGVAKEDFNAYGARRGNHEIMVRATFANIRLRNEMTPEREGPYTIVQPEGRVTSIFEAAESYLEREQPLVVVAGRNYGCGSSRDWAAKGVRLLGVGAIVAESFERIHRSNLVGMGVLPLQLPAGVTRKTLGLDGSEIYDVLGVEDDLTPRCTLALQIVRKDGTLTRTEVTCRLDTNEEIAYFRAGGLLPMMCQRMLEAA